jgi:hypothetical protein
MHKNATKCNETLSKWCKNKHGASQIIDTFETYQSRETTCTWVGPLSSHDTGVYDGPQEAPRYFIVGGEYQGLNLLCVNWAGMHCAEKAVNGLDQ